MNYFIQRIELQKYKKCSLLQIKILNIYKDAIFRKRASKWIPILMYHKVPEQNLDSQHRIFISKKNFETHLLFFKTRGFQTVIMGPHAYTQYELGKYP